jgi:putative sterol carrier protein
MSNLSVRNYHEEDISMLGDLYRSNCGESPYFARSEEFFRHFTRYPGVSPESIFVAVEGESLRGVLIMSVRGREGYNEGKVIELRAKESMAAEALLQRAVDYCENNGIDMLWVRPPTELVRSNVLSEWVNLGETSVTMVKPLSLLSLLQAVWDERVRNLSLPEDVLFLLDDEAIRVRVCPESLDMAEMDRDNMTDSGIIVTMSSKTFVEVIFGLTSPLWALLTRRIKIRGLRHIFPILKLLQDLKVAEPWTIALVDDL